MNNEEVKNTSAATEVAASESNTAKKFFKPQNRLEFCLYVNDFLICKRNFPLFGFIEKSTETLDFKNEVDKIVELIQDDLVSKSRVYLWYHNCPEYPEWEPEVMTEPLQDEGISTFKFTILENGKEVISRIWDGRYYPTYVRKNVDLTNRQVKIIKNDNVNIYDKEEFFEGFGNQLYGDLYTLKAMIWDKEDLVPKIQDILYEVCSSERAYYGKISEYKTTEVYKTRDFKRDVEGNPILDEDGNHLFAEAVGPSREYYYNIDAYNNNANSSWGMAVAEKTRKYMSELYESPKEKYFVKNKKKD